MNEANEQDNRRPEGSGSGPTRSFDGSLTGPGGQIGPFRIERELGRGAVGVVYLAHDTKLDRSVAIKSLPAEVMANPKARSRFSREARLLASVNHPNIATIHEVLEEAEGVGYLVLEYVPGQTLAERIAKGPFKLDDALSIALQIAEAVAAAHEHDVIHRDLKPGNIKITPEGKVKVLDFGLAKAVGGEAVDQQSTVTEPGRVIGTPAYMSPEQARGQTTDKRSDIWAFGCILYEMLTAKIPFKGETISDTLANILQTEPNWQALPENTPVNIQLLLRHCLEKEPRRRLRDIGDIAITIVDTTTELKRSTLPTESLKSDRIRSQGDLRRALPWFITGAVMTILVLFGIIIGLKLGGPAEKQAGKAVLQPTAGPIKAIAVLPFTSISSEAGEDWLVDGVTEMLSIRLGQIKALTVISSRSAMQFKDVSKPMPQIARELGVEGLIEGTVIRVGDDVQITAGLIDGRMDKRIWGDVFQGTFSNILALQSEVTLAIARKIEAALTPEEEVRIASTESVNPDAYEACLKGQFFYWKFTEAGFSSAVDHLEQAIDIDPNYAEAHAWLSSAYWMPSVWGYSRPEESFLKARSAANKAIALDETLAPAHRAIGWIALVYDWDWQKAKLDFERARELNPNDPEVYSGLAWYLTVSGRFDEAIEMMQTAAKLDPFSQAYNMGVASMYLNSGQVERAIEQYKKTLELDPGYVAAMDGLAECYLCMSMYPEAVATLEEAITLAGRTPPLVTPLARAYALSGRKDEAETLLRELQERATYVLPTFFAEVYAALGNTDEAFRWLEKGYQERNWGMSFLRMSPQWDPLRSDPRFDDLLQRMNFPE